MELSPLLVERLIYGFGSQRRRTQDSPVLPDVWAFYATPSEEPRRRDPIGLPVPPPKTEKTPELPLELLLTPHRDAGPAALAQDLRQRLAATRRQRPSKRLPARIAYTHSYVVARLYFDELVQVLLPLTQWWRSYVWKDAFQDEDADAQDDHTLADLLGSFERKDLVTLLEHWSRTQMPELYSRAALGTETLWTRSGWAVTRARSVPPAVAETALPADPETWNVSEDLLWMVRLIGTLQWARLTGPRKVKRHNVEIDAMGRIASLPRDADGKIDFAPVVDAACDLLESRLPVLQSLQPSLWLINRNRQATPAVRDSRRAIKADAATHLFDIHCDKLVWAVIDSGIDATHLAFAKAGIDPKEQPWFKWTRVIKTYDFTRLRPLLDQEVARELLEAPDVLTQTFGDPELDAQLAPIRALLAREAKVDSVRRAHGAGRRDPARQRLSIQLQELAKRIENGREIDWELLDPLLEVPHDDAYTVPTSSHGTHVAGILAANWPDEKVVGICPDLRLYDLRVLDPHGSNDEFTVLAALQFIQYLNLQKETPSIHGANLSLSIRHEVTNYACGRTPVCEECERLVASGVVVVAAGGNAGWDEGLARAAAGAGYRTVSITDPGNAEAVITVGATHRDRPHTYGVSFFSSRGPTGDGRAKPDLVAPGEKIVSTIPGGAKKREDGTSMAAPHVSGAAALLMARHQELIGRPQRIKEILCRTATDLGRERQFQGAGMLDVLRALQSV